MTDYLKRAWAEVRLDRIAHNAAVIRKKLSPGCMLMCVVKADAYGHGDIYTARELSGAGADWFGVSNLEEAISLRARGISEPILIFGITPPEQAGLLGGHGIAQTVHTAEYARRLQSAAASAGANLDIHIKLDTGMSRLGFAAYGGAAQSSVGEIRELAGYSNLNAQGIYTHFACADELSEDSAEYTRTQFERFRSIVKALESADVRFAIKHCCNSAAAMLYPGMHMDMVRPGIALYGLNPSADCAGKLDIRPAMGLYSVISMVKEIGEGVPVSYGRRYKAGRATKVATVPIGYADGFGREFSDKARMLVRGEPARVIGRVCMDQLMLDVTHIADAAAGDLVTIVGKDGGSELAFDELAYLSGTINYELVCAVSKRVPRVYKRGCETVGVVDYIIGKEWEL